MLLTGLVEIASYVRYCLGYIRLSRRMALGKDSDNVLLAESVLPLNDVLAADLEADEPLLIKLDIERQLALEAAGWNFERLRYSDWIEDGFDKKAAIKGILAKVI